MFGMEKWLSGRKRFFAKEVNLKRVPRVRIPPSPPLHIDICLDLPILIGKFNKTTANHRLKINRFTNPSGEKVWRLSGTINGKRIRKNFSTRDEATAERQDLEIDFLKEESEGQTVWTTLTLEQNRDTIAAMIRSRLVIFTDPLAVKRSRQAPRHRTAWIFLN